MELRDLFAQTTCRVSREVFGDGPDSFEVELRMLGRSAVQEMLKKATRRVPERNPAGGSQWRDEVDPSKFRGFLRDEAIVTWRGLTVGAALRYCQREWRTFNTELLAAQLPAETVKDGQASRKNVEDMLAEARGPVWIEDDAREGATRHLETLPFEEWVWSRTTRLSEARADEETSEKNASAGTVPASSST